MTFPVDPAAPVPPDGEKWDASNCVRFCDRCDAEYGITAGADAGDDACAGCGNLTAPHIYPHPRFAAGRAAATPDPAEYFERTKDQQLRALRTLGHHAAAGDDGYDGARAMARAVSTPTDPAASPDPPDMTNMCEGESPDHKPGITPAASPDERLREALREIVAAFPSPPDREMDDEEIEKWYADHGDWFQRLCTLATDRKGK